MFNLVITLSRLHVTHQIHAVEQTKVAKKHTMLLRLLMKFLTNTIYELEAKDSKIKEVAPCRAFGMHTMGIKYSRNRGRVPKKHWNTAPNDGHSLLAVTRRHPLFPGCCSCSSSGVPLLESVYKLCQLPTARTVLRNTKSQQHTRCIHCSSLGRR